MKPAVAIVNYNTVAHLQACLASLQAAGADQIVVKDNGSTDGSLEMVRREFPQVMVHPDRTNLGYGAASNLAVAVCDSPYVVLLNSDTIVPPGTLEALAHYLDTHPRVAIVGPRLHNPDGTLQRSGHCFPRPLTLRPLIRLLPVLRDRSLLTWPHDRPREVAWIKGAALAIRRAAFDEVGGFDPAYFMYFEETDLCARLARAGWKIHFTPAAVVVHHGGASTERVRTDMAVQFHFSMRQFYRIHYPRYRLAQLDTVTRAGMSLAIVRDQLRRATTKDPKKRARLAEDIHVWRRLMQR